MGEREKEGERMIERETGSERMRLRMRENEGEKEGKSWLVLAAHLQRVS